MRTHLRALGTVLGIAATTNACSLVLAPSRHRGDAQETGTRDAATSPDAGLDGGADAGIDAARLDAGPMPDSGLDAGPAPDAGTDAAPTLDAGPLCGTGFACIAAAPAGGWTGPMIFVTQAGGTVPACPADAAVVAFGAHSELTGTGDAACSCTCDPLAASMMTCGTLQFISNSNCTLATGPNSTFTDGHCTSYSWPAGGSSWHVSTPTLTISGGASCTPHATSSVPPTSWGSSHAACTFGTPTSCGASSVCAPELGANERLCVYVDGDVSSCPSTYPNRVSTAESLSDTRGCTTCSCSNPAGSCSGSLDFSSLCGGGTVYLSIPTGTCRATTGIADGQATAHFAPHASCPANGGAASGSATPTTVHTVCCAP